MWWSEAKRLRSAVHELQEMVSQAESERNAAHRACDKLKAELDVAKGRGDGLHELGLSTLELLYKSDDNAKALQAKLADLKHCHEQCEIDRQALAKERDEAKAEVARLKEELDAQFASVAENHRQIDKYMAERKSLIDERDSWRSEAYALQADADALVGMKADRDGQREHMAHAAEVGIETLATLRDLSAKLSSALFIKDPCGPIKSVLEDIRKRLTHEV